MLFAEDGHSSSNSLATAHNNFDEIAIYNEIRTEPSPQHALLYYTGVNCFTVKYKLKAFVLAVTYSIVFNFHGQ